MPHIMFCDDNFIANPKFTKELLKELVPVNRGFRKPLTYSTELSLNLAKDDELLQLCADVNLNAVCIGLETPNQAALKQTRKPQNYQTDIVSDVHKILSYGIGVRAGLIVGFDDDEADIFDRQYEFIQQTCIHGPVLLMEKAVPGTRLWTRLQNEGRLVEEERLIQTNQSEGCKITAEYLFVHTNIIPKKMTRLEMLKGYRQLLARVHGWDSFAGRMMGYLEVVRQGGHAGAPVAGASAAERRAMIRKLCRLIASQPPDVRRRVVQLLGATRVKAPGAMANMVRFLLYQMCSTTIVKATLASLDAQIAHEASVDLAAFTDRSQDGVFPAGFQEEYQRVYPGLYQHVLDRARPAQAPEVLVHAVVEYVKEAWGKPFASIDEPRLYALADEAASGGVGLEAGTALSDLYSNRRKNELRYEVLSYVQRDLRAVRYTPPPARPPAAPEYEPLLEPSSRAVGWSAGSLAVAARVVAATLRQRASLLAAGRR